MRYYCGIYLTMVTPFRKYNLMMIIGLEWISFELLKGLAAAAPNHYQKSRVHPRINIFSATL